MINGRAAMKGGIIVHEAAAVAHPASERWRS